MSDANEGQGRVFHRSPKCGDCGARLPLRKIIVRTAVCWNCEKNVNVAVGEKGQGNLYPEDFTLAEREFARRLGVILEVKYSDVIDAFYPGNVCGGCERLQGNWYMYHDTLKARFMADVGESTDSGPCDFCSERVCDSHGAYHDYNGGENCPLCLSDSLK